MNKLRSAVPGHSLENWKDLMDAVGYANDLGKLRERIQDAQDAIMDEIEDSFQTARQSERKALLEAMNSLRALRKASEACVSHVKADAA